jgi:hypothetical protein
MLVGSEEGGGITLARWIGISLTFPQHGVESTALGSCDGDWGDGLLIAASNIRNVKKIVGSSDW